MCPSESLLFHQMVDERMAVQHLRKALRLVFSIKAAESKACKDQESYTTNSFRRRLAWV